MPNDPWGGTSPDSQDPNKSYNALPGTPGSYDQSSPQTGLGASTDNGHTWGLTDLWGGDNKYADWSLGPENFAPQGDSASFYDSLAKQYAGRDAGQIAGAQTNANTAWDQYQKQYGQQQGMLSMLQGAANGTAPSQAQILMNQGLQQGVANNQALANSARGGPGAWAASQRNAMNTNAAMTQTNIGSAAGARAAEMAQARGMYAQALQGVAGQSLQARQQEGAYGLGMEGENDKAMTGLLGMGQTAGEIANAQENAWSNIVSGATSNNAGNAGQAFGATASAIGTAAAAMSDARAKAMIHSVGEHESSRERGAYEGEPARMLEQLQPYAFHYKPGVAGEDPHAQRFGVMAQDLEKSPMGRSVVRETPQGKMIDVQHAMGVALAGLADLHHRMKDLEVRRG